MVKTFLINQLKMILKHIKILMHNISLKNEGHQRGKNMLKAINAVRDDRKERSSHESTGTKKENSFQS